MGVSKLGIKLFVRRSALWEYVVDKDEYDPEMSIQDIINYEHALDTDGIIETLQGKSFDPPSYLSFNVTVSTKLEE